MSRPLPIYERKKNTRTWLLPQHQLKIESYFEDAVHFILVQVIVNLKSKEILEITPHFFRCPYLDLCPLSLESYQNLKGVKIEKGFNSKVKEKVPSKEGCTHINALLREVGDALVQSYYYLTAKERDGEERRNFLKKQLINTCVAYSDKNFEKTQE